MHRNGALVHGMEDPASYLRDDADCTCLCGRYPERDVFDGDVYGVGAGFGMLLLMMATKRHDGIKAGEFLARARYWAWLI